MVKKLSIVVPLAPEEPAWHGLVDSLCRAFVNLSCDVELLFVLSDASAFSKEHAGGVRAALPGKRVRIISSGAGRAGSLNAGAEAATGEFLWFLHADTVLKSDSLSLLFSAIQAHPDSLLFFDLLFLNDATWLTRLNARGARIRSHILKVPFGDQGFCISRALFSRLGGFPLGHAYGEDHLFVWLARQHGVDIRATGGELYSSARKYKLNGWFKTTVTHQYLWIKQAWGEWRKLRTGKTA